MCVLFQSKEIKAPVKIGRFGLAIQCSDGQTIQVMKIFLHRKTAEILTRLIF